MLDYFVLSKCLGLSSERAQAWPVPSPARGPANVGWFFQRAELGQHIMGDFSNGQAGKKRNEFFKGRVWLQKMEGE